MLDTAVDRLLDRAVVPGYSRLGLLARRRLGSWPADPPRMDGKVALVTGAGSGIGRATARRLAELGADVKVLTRDRERSVALARELEAETGGSVTGVTCDVSDLASLRRFTGRFASDHDRLDVLVNNAGSMPPERTETADGVELTFATHVLGPWVLIDRLRPLLAAARPARVINVSSGGMYAQKLAADDLQYRHSSYRKNAAYARAKRAQLVITEQWAERLAGDGVAVQAMHPGWADTEGVRDALPGFHRLTSRILRDSDEGADTVVWLAASPDALEPSGALWHDRRPRPAHYLPVTRESADDRRRLWDEVSALASS